MKPIILLLSLLAFTFGLQAQTYKPDKYGHISDPKFLKLIKDRGYQLVGAMDSVKPELKTDPALFMIAKVVKDNKELYLDWNGVEYADQNAVRRAFGHPEVYPKHKEEYNYDPGNTPMPEPYYDQAIESPNDYFFPDPKIYRSFQRDGKVGYIIKKDTIIPPIYEQIKTTQADGKLYLLVLSDTLQGVCDIHGKLIVPAVYEGIELINNGTPRMAFIVRQNGKAGVLSSTGKISVPCVHTGYLSWNTAEKHITLMQRKGHKMLHGIIDTNGRVVVQPLYYSIARDPGMNCYVVRTSKYGIIDLDGNLVLDTLYDEISRFRNDLYKLRLQIGKHDLSEGNLEGLFDVKKVEVVLPCEYQLPYLWMLEEEFKEDLICIAKPDIGEKRQLGLMDLNGKIILDPVYNSLEYIAGDKLVVVEKDERYGVIDLNGKTVVPFNYEGLTNIGSEHASKYVYPKGTLVFIKDGKYGIITIKEEVLVPNEYDKLEPIRFGIFYTRNNGFGVMDLQQKPLIEEQADARYFSFKHGIIEYRDAQRTRFLMDFYGNKMIKP